MVFKVYFKIKSNTSMHFYLKNEHKHLCHSGFFLTGESQNSCYYNDEMLASK